MRHGGSCAAFFAGRGRRIAPVMTGYKKCGGTGDRKGCPYGRQGADAGLDSARPVPARKRLCTEIDAETIRKQGSDMHHSIRGVGEFRSGRHCARARIPKPLVLAAFFGYFLSLVTESAPPEAFVGTRSAGKESLSHGSAVTACPPTSTDALQEVRGAGRCGHRPLRYGCKSCGSGDPSVTASP